MGFGSGYFAETGRLAALLLAGSLALSGCASSSYAGIPLTAGAADPELQALARRAQAGDKHAQLELGIRYEGGRGVKYDYRRALKLYEMAAGIGGGTAYVYSPAVGHNGRSQVLPINTGSPQRRLPEAVRRLMLLSRALGRPLPRNIPLRETWIGAFAEAEDEIEVEVLETIRAPDSDLLCIDFKEWLIKHELIPINCELIEIRTRSARPTERVMQFVGAVLPAEAPGDPGQEVLSPSISLTGKRRLGVVRVKTAVESESFWVVLWHE